MSNIFEGYCPKCNNGIYLEFPDDQCPFCGFDGYWNEEYSDCNYWFTFYWLSLDNKIKK